MKQKICKVLVGTLLITMVLPAGFADKHDKHDKDDKYEKHEKHEKHEKKEKKEKKEKPEKKDHPKKKDKDKKKYDKEDWEDFQEDYEEIFEIILEKEENLYETYKEIGEDYEELHDYYKELKDNLPHGLEKKHLPPGLDKRIKDYSKKDWYKDLPYGLAKRFEDLEEKEEDKENEKENENDISEKTKAVVKYENKLSDLFEMAEVSLNLLSEKDIDDNVLDNYEEAIENQKERFEEAKETFEEEVEDIIEDYEEEDKEEVKEEIAEVNEAYLKTLKSVVRKVRNQIQSMETVLEELKTEDDKYIETVDKLNMYIEQGEVLYAIASSDEEKMLFDQEKVAVLFEVIEATKDVVAEDSGDFDIVADQAQKIYDAIRDVEESKILDETYFKNQLSETYKQANIVLADTKDENNTGKYDEEKVQALSDEISNTVLVLAKEDVKIEALKVQNDKLEMAIKIVLESYKSSLDEKLEDLEVKLEEINDFIVFINSPEERDHYGQKEKIVLFEAYMDCKALFDNEDVTIEMIENHILLIEAAELAVIESGYTVQDHLDLLEEELTLANILIREYEVLPNKTDFMEEKRLELMDVYAVAKTMFTIEDVTIEMIEEQIQLLKEAEKTLIDSEQTIESKLKTLEIELLDAYYSMNKVELLVSPTEEMEQKKAELYDVYKKAKTMFTMEDVTVEMINEQIQLVNDATEVLNALIKE